LSAGNVDLVSDVMTGQESVWPTHCEVCGTLLQSVQVGFEEADFSEGKVGTVIARDFCPNPDCPRHDADLAASVGPDETDRDNLPGSMGGDNGGG